MLVNPAAPRPISAGNHPELESILSTASPLQFPTVPPPTPPPLPAPPCCEVRQPSGASCLQATARAGIVRPPLCVPRLCSRRKSASRAHRQSARRPRCAALRSTQPAPQLALQLVLLKGLAR